MHRRDGGRRWRGVVAPIVLVLLGLVVASAPLDRILPAHVHVQIDGQTYRVTEKGWQRAHERALEVFADRQQAAVSAMDAAVRAQVARVFELPRAKVEGAADWYFSPRGQAVRARITMRSWWGGDERSEARKAAALGKRLFPEAEWARAPSHVIEELMRSASERRRDVIAGYRATLHEELAAYRTEAIYLGVIPLVVMDLNPAVGGGHSRASPFVTSGRHAFDRQVPAWSTAVGETLSARRAAQAETLRAAGRESPVICEHVGRFPRLCKAGVPALTTVGAGLLVLFLDEKLNRASLEAALRQELEREEDALTKVLGAVFIDGLTEDLAARGDTIREQAQRVRAGFST